MGVLISFSQRGYIDMPVIPKEYDYAHDNMVSYTETTAGFFTVLNKPILIMIHSPKDRAEQVKSITVKELKMTIFFQLSKRRYEAFFINGYCINKGYLSSKEAYAKSQEIKASLALPEGFQSLLQGGIKRGDMFTIAAKG